MRSNVGSEEALHHNNRGPALESRPDLDKEQIRDGGGTLKVSNVRWNAGCIGID